MGKLDIIGILKLGLPGLVFLLSVLSYWLLSSEQKKERPSATVLKSIKQFMYINIVLALLTVAAPIVEKFPSNFPKNEVFDIKARCISELQKGTAAVCTDAGYANRYLLVKDKSTGKLIQVFSRSITPCVKEDPHIAINPQDAENLGWQSGINAGNVEVVAALPGYMFALF